MIKGQLKCSPDGLLDKILDVVQDNMDFLRENPKCLAWCMMNYSIIGYACNVLEIGWENPKYPILDREWLSEEDSDLVYSAWSTTIGKMEYALIIPDPQNEPRPHPKMTLDDFVSLKLNDNYRYKEIYPNRHCVIDHLLICPGNGYEWDKDGYLQDYLHNPIFQGFTLAQDEVPAKIRKAIDRISKDPRIKDKFLEIKQESDRINRLTVEERNEEERASRKQQCIERDKKDRNKTAEEAAEDYDRLERIIKAEIKKREEDPNWQEKEDARKEEHDKKQKYFAETERWTGLCEYSSIVTMPDNAHASYVREAIRIAKLFVEGKIVVRGNGDRKENPYEITDGPPTKEQIEIAQSILDRFLDKIRE